MAQEQVGRVVDATSNHLERCNEKFGCRECFLLKRQPLQRPAWPHTCGFILYCDSEYIFTEPIFSQSF